MADPNWATAAEAAQILNVTVNAVYQQVADGRIPKAAIQPRVTRQRVRISRAWLTGQTDNLTAITRLTQADIDRIAETVIAALDARDRKRLAA